MTPCNIFFCEVGVQVDEVGVEPPRQLEHWL
jgi:hypothetical protein